MNTKTNTSKNTKEKECFCEDQRKDGKDIACFICGKGAEIKENSIDQVLDDKEGLLREMNKIAGGRK